MGRCPGCALVHADDADLLAVHLLPQAKYLAAHTKKSDEEIMRDFARPRYFTPYEATQYGLIDTVLEPKEGIVYKGWDERGSDIGDLTVMDDDEQPLPTNVMYPGTSDYCEWLWGLHACVLLCA